MRKLRAIGVAALCLTSITGFRFVPQLDDARVHVARALIGPNHAIVDVSDATAARGEPDATESACPRGTYSQIIAHPPEGYREMPQLDADAQAKVVHLYNALPPHEADVQGDAAVHLWLGAPGDTSSLDTVLFLVAPRTGCALTMAHLGKADVDYLLNDGPPPVHTAAGESG